jgi:hypothetical protein
VVLSGGDVQAGDGIRVQMPEGERRALAPV